MSEARRPFPTDQKPPGGFERLTALRDRIGEDTILRRLQSGQTECFEFRPEDGALITVSVEDWRSGHAAFMLNQGYKCHYFSPDPSNDPAIPREVFSYGSDWRLLVVREAGAGVAESVSRRGGAPMKHDWASAAGVAARFIVDNDPNQADLTRELTAWFLRQAKQPDPKDIRDFVKVALGAYSGES